MINPNSIIGETMTCKRTLDLLKRRGYTDRTAAYNEGSYCDDDCAPLPPGATLWDHPNDDPIVTDYVNDPFDIDVIVFRSFDDLLEYNP